MLGTRLERGRSTWPGPGRRTGRRLWTGSATLGLVRADGGALELTRRGRFVQNAVLHELMEFA